MKTTQHIIATLLFLPITILFIANIFFEMLWRFLYELHPIRFDGIIVPDLPNNGHENALVIFLSKMVVLLFFVVECFWKQLKEVFKYQF